MNELSKVTEYKINIQKSVAFLYTNDEISKEKVKKQCLLKSHKKIIKYLRINLTKEVKYL